MKLRLLFIVFSCAVWYLINVHVRYDLGKLRFFVLISHVSAIDSGRLTVYVGTRDFPKVKHIYSVYSGDC